MYALIISKHDHKVYACLVLDAVQPKDFDLLVLPGGKLPTFLQKNPDVVALIPAFAQAIFKANGVA